MFRELTRARRETAAEVRTALRDQGWNVPAGISQIVPVVLGNPEQAEEWVERATKIDPRNPGAWYNAACTYAQIDQVDKAIDSLEKQKDI